METERSFRTEGLRKIQVRLLVAVFLIYILTIVSGGYVLHRHVRQTFELQIVNHVESMASMLEELGNQLQPVLTMPQQRLELQAQDIVDPARIGPVAPLSKQPVSERYQHIEEVKRLANNPVVSILRSVIREANFQYYAGGESRKGYFFLYNFNDGMNLAHGSDSGLELTILKTGRNRNSIELLESTARNGGGCVTYKWDSQDRSDRQSKLGCVRQIKSSAFDERIGGVWIGTGMFLYEIDQNFEYLLYRLLLLMSGSFLLLITTFALFCQRPAEELLQQLLDAVAIGILVTRRQGSDERIILANRAAQEFYGSPDRPLDLNNQALDRIIPRRFESNRKTDYVTGSRRLDYEVTLPHGMTRLVRDIVRGLDGREDSSELVHSVSELKLTSASDFPSRKYLPPLLSKTGVDMGFFGSSTLLYCDLSGFIKRCDEMGISLNDAVDELKRLMGTITDLVLKSGGTVEKFIGERVLIHFGVIHGTDRSAGSARSCVTLALQIRAALRAHRALHEERFPPTSCRIGIATSQVLACSLGTEQRSDFTLVGQAVITAETLAQEADVDEILLSQSTVGLLGERFEVGKVKITSVLWGDKPLPAYPIERERPEVSPEQSGESSPHQTKLPARS